MPRPQSTLTDFNGKLKEQRMPISESSSGGMILYELRRSVSQDAMLAYGMNKNYLFLGSRF